MTDRDDPTAPRERAATPPPRLSEAASASAPFLYAEAVPAAGYAHGIVSLTLSASRLMPPGAVHARDHAVVAHLRLTIPAALALKDAVDKALLAARRPAGGTPERPN